jgi:hypothetical protein
MANFYIQQMKNHLVALLMLMALLCRAQNTGGISGLVLSDSVPLPYASVKLLKTISPLLRIALADLTLQAYKPGNINCASVTLASKITKRK